MRRPENNHSLANAGSGGVGAGRWAWMPTVHVSQRMRNRVVRGCCARAGLKPAPTCGPIRTRLDDSFAAQRKNRWACRGGFQTRPSSMATYSQPRGPRPLRQGGFETRPYMNPDAYAT